MDKRKEDRTPLDRYRPGRFFVEDGKWYYHTREGSIEGPFQHRLEAEQNLKTYINIFDGLSYKAKHIAPSLYAACKVVKLEPIQMQWR